MNISVIVPAWDAGATLARCLSAVAASTFAPREVIVVDDGSTDATADLAASLGARVLRVAAGPVGPAAARNRGGNAARSEILVFLDADVAVHPEALALIEGRLSAHRDVAALFGSYDDDPPAAGLASRYKNLVHHHTHQASRREASTFWAGCGAIRRDVFLACGGFDEAYRAPSIEDIELGLRLRAGGHRIWSCPDVQATHLKRWTLTNLILTDIFRRALPWSRLIVRTGQLPDDLNVGRKARLGAAAAWTAVASLLAGCWDAREWFVVPLALALLGALDADLLQFFRRRGGIRFAGGAAALHLLYYLYSSATFALVALCDRPRSRRRTGPVPGDAVLGPALDVAIVPAGPVEE